MTKIAEQKILVLDFGSQYAQLIARRVRQQQVYCEIVRHDITAERIGQLRPRGLILSGGPSSVYEPGAEVRPGHFPPGHPGAGHLLRHAVGVRGPGRPRGQRPAREYGRAQCRLVNSDRATCWPACRRRSRCG